MGQWTTELANDGNFERFFRRLGDYNQAVLAAAIEQVLERLGPDTCSGEWGKALGKGLYEFRVRRSLEAILREAGLDAPAAVNGPHRQVALRVFCTFHGEKIVVLLGGYDTQRDPSKKRQTREIENARRALASWKERQKRD